MMYDGTLQMFTQTADVSMERLTFLRWLIEKHGMEGHGPAGPSSGPLVPPTSAVLEPPVDDAAQTPPSNRVSPLFSLE